MEMRWRWRIGVHLFGWRISRVEIQTLFRYWGTREPGIRPNPRVEDLGEPDDFSTYSPRDDLDLSLYYV